MLRHAGAPRASTGHGPDDPQRPAAGDGLDASGRAKPLQRAAIRAARRAACAFDGMTTTPAPRRREAWALRVWGSASVPVTLATTASAPPRRLAWSLAPPVPGRRPPGGSGRAPGPGTMARGNAVGAGGAPCAAALGRRR